MTKELIKLTGKVKKLEAVKGTDRLILENLNFEKANEFFAVKKCANREEAVEVTIKVLQENLPGTV